MLDAVDDSRVRVAQTLWRPPATDELMVSVREECLSHDEWNTHWPVACHRALVRAVEAGEIVMTSWYDGVAPHNLTLSVSDDGLGSQLRLTHCNIGARLSSPWWYAGWVSPNGVGCYDITCPLVDVDHGPGDSDVDDLIRTCGQRGSTKRQTGGKWVDFVVIE